MALVRPFRHGSCTNLCLQRGTWGTPHLPYGGLQGPQLGNAGYSWNPGQRPTPTCRSLPSWSVETVISGRIVSDSVPWFPTCNTFSHCHHHQTCLVDYAFDLQHFAYWPAFLSWLSLSRLTAGSHCIWRHTSTAEFSQPPTYLQNPKGHYLYVFKILLWAEFWHYLQILSHWLSNSKFHSYFPFQALDIDVWVVGT